MFLILNLTWNINYKNSKNNITNNCLNLTKNYANIIILNKYFIN